MVNCLTASVPLLNTKRTELFVTNSRSASIKPALRTLVPRRVQHARARAVTATSRRPQ
jgi:hypothetical protein